MFAPFALFAYYHAVVIDVFCIVTCLCSAVRGLHVGVSPTWMPRHDASTYQSKVVMSGAAWATNDLPTPVNAGYTVSDALRILDGGGVYRWLQIGCEDSFGRFIQVSCVFFLF